MHAILVQAVCQKEQNEFVVRCEQFVFRFCCSLWWPIPANNQLFIFNTIFYFQHNFLFSTQFFIFNTTFFIQPQSTHVIYRGLVLCSMNHFSCLYSGLFNFSRNSPPPLVFSNSGSFRVERSEGYSLTLIYR